MSREPARSVAVQNEKSAIRLRLCNFDPQAGYGASLRFPILSMSGNITAPVATLIKAHTLHDEPHPQCVSTNRPAKSGARFAASQVGPIHTLVVGIEHRSDMLTAVTLDRECRWSTEQGQRDYAKHHAEDE
jgi:hypothetical protein